MTFTVTLDNAVDGGFTVVPGFIGGTATQGVDYTSTTPGIAFTGTAGETQTFSVATTEDPDVESDETLTIGLRVNGTSHPVTASDTATGTIRDDDTVSLVSASVTIENAKATEGAALSFTVTLDNAVPGGFSVTPTYEDGTASQGSDYTANTAAVAFTGTAGETRTFSVSAHEDGKTEYYEYFTVGLAVSGTSHAVTATDKATGVIYDASASASEGAFAMSSSQPPSQIQDKGSYWRLWSPPEPTTKRYEYFCDIPKRIVETTNRAIRSKLLSIPCKLHQGGIPGGRGRRNVLDWILDRHQRQQRQLGLQLLPQQVHDVPGRQGHPASPIPHQRRPECGGGRVFPVRAQVVHEDRLPARMVDPERVRPHPDRLHRRRRRIRPERLAGASLGGSRRRDRHRDRSDEERSEPRRGPHVQRPGRRQHGHRHRGHRLPDREQLQRDDRQGEKQRKRHLHPDPDRRRPDGGGRAHHGDGQRQHSDQRQDIDNPGSTARTS